MAGTWTCSEDEDFGSLGDNKVEITGGTSGSPARMSDFVSADRAGEAVLMAATNGAKGMTLTYQIRPVEDLALLISFIVASKTTETDYIFITGTDFAGNAQTESIDVSAGNGTYTSTKYFRTITQIDCEDAGDGSGTAWVDGTVRVTQPCWGLIWDHGNGIYICDAHVDFGDGSTSTYFQSEKERVYWADNRDFVVELNATLELGDLVGSWGVNGSYWSCDPNSEPLNVLPDGNGGTLLIYASQLEIRGQKRFNICDGTFRVKNSIINNRWISGPEWKRAFQFLFIVDTVEMDRVYFHSFFGFTFAGSITSLTAQDVHWHNQYRGCQSEINRASVTNAKLTSMFVEEYKVQAVDSNLEVINPEQAVSSLTLGDDSNWLKEIYTCNIHLADKDGTDLNSASVDCEYANLVEGSDSKTYKCIADHTAVDATHKPITGSDWSTYWELYDAGGGLGGDWNTGFAYKSGTAEFSTQTTDANGDMTEQTIQYKKWVGTSEVLEVRIHKFTYSKETYETLVLNNITVDGPIDWHLELQPIAYPPAAWIN